MLETQGRGGARGPPADAKALEAWRQRNAEWSALQEKLAARTGRDPSQLAMAHARQAEFRARKEASELIERATPMWEKYGSHYWMMSLRDTHSRFVRAGHLFSGLWCELKEDKSCLPEVVRTTASLLPRSGFLSTTKQVTGSFWRDSRMVTSKRMSLLSELPRLVPTMQLDEGVLADLEIRGVPLDQDDNDVAGQPRVPPEPLLEALRTEDIAAMPGTIAEEQAEEEEEAKVPVEEKKATPRAGPAAALSTDRLSFFCGVGESASAELRVLNTGSTVLYYEWVGAGTAGLSQPGPTLPFNTGSSEPSDFWTAVHKGTLLPGAGAQCVFSFTAREPGVFLRHLRLQTTPPLPGGEVVLTLKGCAVSPDNGSVARAAVLSEERAIAAKETVQDILTAIIKSIRPPPPDPRLHRQLFYSRNRQDKLWYYSELMPQWLSLADDTIALHRPKERRALQWDFSARHLRTLIQTLPRRHVVRRGELQARLDELMGRATARPPPPPHLYDLGVSLWSTLARHIPRAALQLRLSLGLPTPYDTPTPQEEELVSARQVAANDWHTNNMASARDTERTGARRGSNTNIIVTEPVVDPQLEAEYKQQLYSAVRARVCELIHSFDSLAQQSQERDTLVSRFSARRSATRHRVAMWGNDTLAPEFGKKRETPEEAREREQRRLRLNFGSPVKEEKQPEELPLYTKGTVAMAAGIGMAVAVTWDGFYYCWLNAADPRTHAKMQKSDKRAPLPASAISRPGSRIVPPPKPAAVKKSRKEDGTVDEKAEGPGPAVAARPCALPLLQGIECTRLAVGPSGVLMLDDDGRAWSWDLEMAEAKRVYEGLSIREAAFGQEGMFTLLLDKAGKVYSCGDAGKYGVLGHGDKKSRETPEPIAALDGAQIVQVAAGGHHAMALAANGVVYAWGNGDSGALGVGDKRGRTVPTALDAALFGGEHVTAIATGTHHSMALTASGHVYTWGRGYGGVLGHGDAKDVEAPKRVTALEERVDEVAAGSTHCLARVGGAVCSWGRGSRGCLGHGTEEDAHAPRLVEGLKEYSARGLCASGAFSMALLQWEEQEEPAEIAAVLP